MNTCLSEHKKRDASGSKSLRTSSWFLIGCMDVKPNNNPELGHCLGAENVLRDGAYKKCPISYVLLTGSLGTSQALINKRLPYTRSPTKHLFNLLLSEFYFKEVLSLLKPIFKSCIHFV